VAQVWALDRETAEPRFLDRGEADAVRAVAKERWRCPVPGCEGPISTRGGSRRDHFFHVEEGAGHSDGESVFHLQAKAMLADWARRLDATAEVAEELTVKDPAASRNRRPDVLAAWPDGRRVAFEIEYKACSPVDWRAKQRDFERMEPPVVAVWLFGHLHRYLAQPPVPAGQSEGTPWDEVLLRELPRAVAAVGRPVLHINPLERTVGTVVVDGVPLDQIRKRPRWSAREDLSHVGLRLPGAGDFQGRLVVCLIDDCRLDPVLGLVTPAMEAVAASRLAVDAAAAEDREKDRVAAEHAAEALARQPSREDRKAYALAAAERDKKRWQDNPLRQALVRHYGQIPPLLAERLNTDYGVHGHHEHWHCVAFRDLVKGHVGKAWTVKQVYARVADHFTLHKDPLRRGPAISGFLHHLRDHGIVTFDDDWGSIKGPITVLHDDPVTPALGPRPPSIAPEPSRSTVPEPSQTTSISQLPGHEWARRVRLRLDAERAEKRATAAVAVDTPGAGPDAGLRRLLAAGVAPDAAAALVELLDSEQPW
jgi:hypothetical protein